MMKLLTLRIVPPVMMGFSRDYCITLVDMMHC